MSEKMYPPPQPIGRVFAVRDDGIPTCLRSACPRWHDNKCSDDSDVSPSLYLHLCIPEIRSRIAPPVVGGEIRRVQTRCASCRAWQSVHPRDMNEDGRTARCGGCGGVSHGISMDEHMATVPRAAREADELKLNPTPGSHLVKSE